MPSFSASRRVRHSATQMFDLVADVEAYPQFVPLCKALRVLSRTPDGEAELFVASMEIGYEAIRQTFTTKVRCERAADRIDVEYVNGPFRYLHGRWHFADRPDGDGAVVGFDIAYEFKSRMLGLVMGRVFDQMFRQFAGAFERRADVVYGRPEPSARRLA